MKLEYIGSISPVALKGKGLIKRGDIVDFDEQQVPTLSNENWKKVENPTFDKKTKTFSEQSREHYKNKQHNKTRKEREEK